MLSVVCWSLATACCQLSGAVWLLCAVSCLLQSGYCVLSVIWCSLATVCCQLSAAVWLLRAVSCLLQSGYCVLVSDSLQSHCACLPVVVNLLAAKALHFFLRISSAYRKIRILTIYIKKPSQYLGMIWLCIVIKERTALLLILQLQLIHMLPNRARLSSIKKED